MKKKILIYDDDEDILLLSKAILNKFGFMVETLTRCENILTDIKEIEPDLILIDLWIPEIGGEKAAEMVKENEVTKNIPILIFSSNANIKEICEKVNAEGYIAKPFSISCFNETIQKHLGYINN